MGADREEHLRRCADGVSLLAGGVCSTRCVLICAWAWGACVCVVRVCDARVCVVRMCPVFEYVSWLEARVCVFVYENVSWLEARMRVRV